MRLRLVASVALPALLAVAASAQPAYLATRGWYAALGNGSPERLPFPTDADPGLVVGLRLSPHVDIQFGYSRQTTERTSFSQTDVSVWQRWERTGAVALSAGYVRSAGPALLQGRLSLGYDDYSFRRTTYRPDSTMAFRRDGTGNLARTYALTVDQTETALGKFIHTGASASVAVPIVLGRVRILPMAGLAGTLSSRTSGTLEPQGARWMPYAQLPVTVRVGEVALTLETMIGTAFGAEDRTSSLFISRSPASKAGTPVATGSLRVNF